MKHHRMSDEETSRLLGYQWAKKHSPRTNTVSRRTSKSASQAVGMKFLKGGRIVSEVSMEKVFLKRKGIC